MQRLRRLSAFQFSYDLSAKKYNQEPTSLRLVWSLTNLALQVGHRHSLWRLRRARSRGHGSSGIHPSERVRRSLLWPCRTPVIVPDPELLGFSRQSALPSSSIRSDSPVDLVHVLFEVLAGVCDVLEMALPQRGLLFVFAIGFVAFPVPVCECNSGLEGILDF